MKAFNHDRDALLSFYAFPAAHWKHVRATNIIERVFATVRLRTYKTQRMGTNMTTLAMAFELIKEAEESRRKITRWRQVKLVRGAGRCTHLPDDSTCADRPRGAPSGPKESQVPERNCLSFREVQGHGCSHSRPRSVSPERPLGLL